MRTLGVPAALRESVGAKSGRLAWKNSSSWKNFGVTMNFAALFGTCQWRVGTLQVTCKSQPTWPLLCLFETLKKISESLECGVQEPSCNFCGFGSKLFCFGNEISELLWEGNLGNQNLKTDVEGRSSVKCCAELGTLKAVLGVWFRPPNRLTSARKSDMVPSGEPAKALMLWMQLQKALYG